MCPSSSRWWEDQEIIQSTRLGPWPDSWAAICTPFVGSDPHALWKQRTRGNDHGVGRVTPNLRAAMAVQLELCIVYIIALNVQRITDLIKQSFPVLG